MAKKIYGGIAGVGRRCVKAYCGINNTARRIRKAYYGVNGIAQLLWTNNLGMFFGAGGNVIVSTDGMSWQTLDPAQLPFTGSLGGLTFGKDMFLICYGGIVYFSENGTTWAPTGSDVSLMFFAYGNDRFMAVSGGFAHSSIDGKQWTKLSSLIAQVFSTPNLSGTCSCMFYGNGIFLAGSRTTSSSYAKIGYSLDNGVTWNRANINSTSDSVTDFAFGNGKYVAVGYNTRCYYSTDGITWTRGGSGLSSAAYNIVVFGKGVFVCNGNNKNMYYSTNGITWTKIQLSITVSNLNIAYGNGKFIATTKGSGTAAAPAYYSLDGINWTAIPAVNAPQCESVIFSIDNGSGDI